MRTTSRRVARTESELGPIDLLVANAGVSGPTTATWETPAEDWWRVFEVNVLGVYLCCRTVLPGMIERGSGRIVNISSGASYLPGAGGSTAYGPSKAAVSRFSELLEREVGSRGVHVFHISPGLVRTDMTEGMFPEPDDAPWTPPSWRHDLCACSRRVVRTPWRAGTSTPSTTTSRR